MARYAFHAHSVTLTHCRTEWGQAEMTGYGVGALQEKSSLNKSLLADTSIPWEAQTGYSELQFLPLFFL